VPTIFRVFDGHTDTLTVRPWHKSPLRYRMVRPD